MIYDLKTNIKEYFANMDDEKRIRIKNFHQNNSFIMNSECIACIVIPAHNEAQNICKLLNEILEQKFSEKSCYGLKNFEIVIVENNSDDNTYDVVEQFIKNNKLENFYIISTELSGKEKGSIGAVRKLGSDMALYRVLMSKLDLKEFYLIAIDADNSIDEMHLDNVLNTFAETKADTLAGYGIFDVEYFNYHPVLYKLAQSIDKYIYKIYDNKPLAHRVLGPNHAIKSSMYLKIGGYAVWQLAEDIHIGMETERLGGKIAWLNSPIKLNLRRSQSNPFEMITREAWGRSQFSSDDISVLIRSDKKIVNEFNSDYVKKSLTVFVDDTIQEIYMNGKISLNEAIYSERTEFIDICKRFKVDIKYIPDFDLFKIDRYNPAIYRRWADNKTKENLFLESYKLLHKLYENMNMLICGGAAKFLLDKNESIPDFINVFMPKDNVILFIELLKNEDCSLFCVEHLNKLAFFKRVINDKFEFNSRTDFYIFKVDEHMVPYYDGPNIKVNFYRNESDDIILDDEGLTKLDNSYLNTNKDYEGIPIMDKVMLALLNRFLNTRNPYPDIYTLNKEEFIRYDDAINRFIINCTHYLIKNNNIITKEDVSKFIYDIVGNLKKKSDINNSNIFIEKIYNILKDDDIKDINNQIRNLIQVFIKQIYK